MVKERVKSMRMSKFLSIYIANITFDPDSPRPVVIMEFIKPKRKLKVLEITHRSPKNKPTNIKHNYYQIKEWSQANLDKPSWVDTNSLASIPTKQLLSHSPIGKLTPLDANELFQFLIKNHNIKF